MRAPVGGQDRVAAGDQPLAGEVFGGDLGEVLLVEGAELQRTVVGHELADGRELELNANACSATWLDAWSDVLRLCDATGIHSIGEFDDRFPMTQSLYNWSQDMEDALWNAGLGDREFLLARIAVCEEALRRFRDEDQLMTENRRRALAESYFEVGRTETAEELFQSWLAADPRWGFGWIGWAVCHIPRAGRPKNYGRAEELLRRGYSTPGVRDREAIAQWLQILCKETGRLREAREFGQQARQLRCQAPPMTVSCSWSWQVRMTRLPWYARP